jgi:hypothetical protein
MKTLLISFGAVTAFEVGCKSVTLHGGDEVEQWQAGVPVPPDWLSLCASASDRVETERPAESAR